MANRETSLRLLFPSHLGIPPTAAHGVLHVAITDASIDYTPPDHSVTGTASFHPHSNREWSVLLWLSLTGKRGCRKSWRMITNQGPLTPEHALFHGQYCPKGVKILPWEVKMILLILFMHRVPRYRTEEQCICENVTEWWIRNRCVEKVPGVQSWKKSELYSQQSKHTQPKHPPVEEWINKMWYLYTNGILLGHKKRMK